MIVGLSFATLLIFTLCGAARRARLRAKSRADWFLDLANLSIQGTLIPLLQVSVATALLPWLVPSLHGRLPLGFWGGLAVELLVVDYLYYWNHRLLHSRALWPIHLIHHSVTEMDVFATSRNTLWSSFLIVYLYLHALLLFLLDDPSGVLLGAALTASLDLWKHSELHPPAWLGRLLGFALILPVEHAWHHAAAAPAGNYGANFKLWDRLHGTWLPRAEGPAALGLDPGLGVWRRLLWPFAERSAA